MEQGKQLANLLARIAELDKEICRYTGLESRVLEMGQFVALIADLSAARKPALEESVACCGLYQAMSQAKLKLGNEKLLSVYQSALLQTVELIFRHLQQSADVEPQALPLIYYLQFDILHSLSLDRAFVSDPTHGLRRFLEVLLRICRLFDAYSGRRSEQLLASLAEIVESLRIKDERGAHAAEVTERLVQLFNQHNDESLELARKLIIREQGECLQENARQLVNRNMLEAVDGRWLPPIFVRFLEDVWSKYMYITYLRHGEDSREWASAIATIRDLAESLGIRGRDEMFHFYGKHVPKALANLKEAAYSIHQDEYLVKQLLDYFDDLFISIMNEELLDIPGDWQKVRRPRGDDQKEILDEEDANIKALRVGDWYKLNQDGLHRRTKLIEKNLHYGYCLFTNLSGIRISRLTLRQTSRLMDNGELLRMEHFPVLTQAIAHCTNELGKQIPALQNQVEDAEQAWHETRKKALLQQEEAERQALRRQEEERLRQLQEERRLKEEKERLERLRQEEEQRQKQEQQQAELTHTARLVLLEKIVDQTKRMQPGGWLELILDDDGRVSCKLGLRLKSSGKMIFVDSLGRKLAQFTDHELAEKIVDGSASILDYGVAFDETLGGLINERSEKIYHEETQ